MFGSCFEGIVGSWDNCDNKKCYKVNRSHKINKKIENKKWQFLLLRIMWQVKKSTPCLYHTIFYNYYIWPIVSSVKIVMG